MPLTNEHLYVSDRTTDAALMTVTAARSIGSTILEVNTIVGVPDKFIASVGTALPTGFINPATVTNFYGHLNGTDLEIDGFIPGSTDTGNTEGQICVIKPNTEWANMVAEFINESQGFTNENLIFNSNFILPGQHGASSGYGGTPEGWSLTGVSAIQASQPTPLSSVADFAARIGITTGNILGLWDLSQGLTDLSGNGNTLTAVNSPTVVSTGLWGNAYDFVRASSQHLITAATGNLNPSSSQTWFVLCKPDSVNLTATGTSAANAWVVGNYASTGQGSGIPYLKVSTAPTRSMDHMINRIQGNISGVGAVSTDIQASLYAADADSWQLAVMSFDDTANTLSIMVNGQLYSLPATGSVDTSGTNRRFAIGTLGNLTGATYFFDGIVQAAGMLNVALSAAQMRRMWEVMMFSGVRTVRSGTDGHLSQMLSLQEIQKAVGYQIHLSAEVYAATPASAVIQIVNEAGTVLASASPTTTSSWERVTCSYTVPSGTTSLGVRLRHITTNGTIYWRKVALSVGYSAPIYSNAPEDYRRFGKLMDLRPPEAPDGYRYAPDNVEHILALRRTNQSIPGSTWTSVVYDVVGNILTSANASINTTTGAITIGRTGWYNIFARFDMVAAGVGLVAIGLSKNGSSIPANSVDWLRQFSGSVNSGGNPTGMVVQERAWLKAGDTYTVQAFQSAGGANNIIPNQVNGSESDHSGTMIKIVSCE